MRIINIHSRPPHHQKTKLYLIQNKKHRAIEDWVNHSHKYTWANISIVVNTYRKWFFSHSPKRWRQNAATNTIIYIITETARGTLTVTLLTPHNNWPSVCLSAGVSLCVGEQLRLAPHALSLSLSPRPLRLLNGLDNNGFFPPFYKMPACFPWFSFQRK